jgi:Uma2 family endonuclease
MKTVEIQNPEDIEYPFSDGAPLGENTVQVDWILLFNMGLRYLLSLRDDVFIASDLFWYPVKGDASIVTAPDVLVVFGRPKGDRMSYKQWEENDVPMHVVIEILSPGNRVMELKRKFEFYSRYGVEEYYTYEPETNELEAWVRTNGKLKFIDPVQGFTSPLLGIRFEFPADGGELKVYGPDGLVFETIEALRTRHYEELDRKRADLELTEKALKQSQQSYQESQQALQKEQQKRLLADKIHADMIAKLRAKGIDPETL